MRILIMASSLDPAGSALYAALEGSGFTRHEVTTRLVDDRLIEHDPPEGFDLVIFLSKHAARSRNDAMCVHAIGNFGSAQLGGRDGMLVPTNPAILTALYRKLKDRSPETAVGSYEVSLEAVHHGPFSTTPAVFYELGASEENWEDREAARIMADCLHNVLEQDITPKPSFFGLGSNHYCAGFAPLTDELDFAGSCAKHDLEHLTKEHLEWIVKRYDRIVIDRNSLGTQKARILSLLDELKLPYVDRKSVRREQES